MFLPHPRVHHTSAPHEAFRPVPLCQIDRGRPPEQTETLFTGVDRVYEPKRLRRNERGGEERDCGAKREVARQQPASATRKTAARQDSWRSDNQPAQVRCHKTGGGATREVAEQLERRQHDKRGTGAWCGERGDDATTNRWRERGTMRQALARR